MKEELMFDGITNIREDIIERAENFRFQKKETKKSGKTAWVKWAALAAGILLVLWSPFLYIATQKAGLEGPPEAGRPGDMLPGQIKPGDDMPGVVTPYRDVWIYYVNGASLDSEQEYLPAQAADVFAAWKEKNGIGDEVRLLDFEIQSNATTEVKEFEGETVAEHVMGERRSLYLTVSKNLEVYYAVTDSELLLESLKKTMTGYSNVEFQEYYLTLK